MVVAGVLTIVITRESVTVFWHIRFSISDLVIDIIMNNSSLGEQESRVAFHYRPPTELQEGNFFRLVCLLFCLYTGRSPCDHYPWCLEPHCAVTPLPPWISDLGSPSPVWPLPDPSQPQHQTWDLSHWLRPSVTDIWWPILEPCSNLFTWEPPWSNTWWQHWRPVQTCSSVDSHWSMCGLAIEKNWIRIYWLRHKRQNSPNFIQSVYAFIKSHLLNVCCDDYNLYWSTRTLFNFSRDVIKWRKYFLFIHWCICKPWSQVTLLTYGDGLRFTL